MFRCMKPGCPVDCGTRRHPGCADRMLCRALFLALAAVLVFSLSIGLRDLNASDRSSSVIGEPPPVACTEMVQLVSEAPDDAR